MTTTSKGQSFLRSLLAAFALVSVLAGANISSAQLDDAADGATSTRAAAAATGVVNLNTATEEELIRLPGIGPAKAQAILRMREQRGEFKKVEDVLRVRGIGRKTFRKLQPMLALEGQTTLR